MTQADPINLLNSNRAIYIFSMDLSQPFPADSHYSFATEPYHDAIYFSTNPISLISPALSLVATFLATIVCILSKFYKEPLGLMVFAINTADFFFCFCKLTVIVHTPPNTTYCKILQVFTYISLLSSSFWGVFFGHALFVSAKRQTTLVLSGLTKYYCIFAIVIPVIVGMTIPFTDYVIYSPAVQTCVHRIYDGKVDYTFIFYGAIPIIGVCLMSILWYFLAGFHLKKLLGKQNASSIIALIAYPAIFIICWTPIMFKNTLAMVGIVPSNTMSIILRELCQLHGFLDAVVYGGGIQNLQKRVKGVVSKCCLCITGRSTSLRPTSDVALSSNPLLSKSDLEQSKRLYGIESDIIYEAPNDDRRSRYLT